MPVLLCTCCSCIVKWLWNSRKHWLHVGSYGGVSPPIWELCGGVIWASVPGSPEAVHNLEWRWLHHEDVCGIYSTACANKLLVSQSQKVFVTFCVSQQSIVKACLEVTVLKMSSTLEWENTESRSARPFKFFLCFHKPWGNHCLSCVKINKFL